MLKVSSETPPPPRPRASRGRDGLLVYLAVMRGREIIAQRVAPALRVVREPGQPPRVVPIEPPPPTPAAA